MTNTDWKFTVLAWAAGVIAGAQVCPRRATPEALVSPAPSVESPAMRLAAAVVEAGDAAADMVAQKIF